MANIINKKVAMVIAFKNFKDEEYFVPKQVLEKAGVEVKTFSNKIGIAIGAGGGEARVDVLLENLNPIDFDVIVFVGGPGALENFDNEKSYKLAKAVISQDKVLAAICISPVILAKAGVLKGKKATVWSSALNTDPIKILEQNGAVYEAKPVVRDGKIITANGPTAAGEFGQEILQALSK